MKSHSVCIKSIFVLLVSFSCFITGGVAEEAEVVAFARRVDPEVGVTNEEEPRRKFTLFKKRSSESEAKKTVSSSEESSDKRFRLLNIFADSENKASDEVTVVKPANLSIGEQAGPTLTELYPSVEIARVPENHKVRSKVQQLLDDITASLIERIEEFDDPELFAVNGDEAINGGVEATWADDVSKSLWDGQQRMPSSLAKSYQLSLQHSHQVKSLSRVPLIYEATAKETLVDYSAEFFANGDFDHTDEPTGSILTTGETGRFLQDNLSGDVGIRKKLFNGAQVQLSNRLSTLDNNSEFLDPNPQTGSEVVLSLLHPLIRGGGTDYQLSTFRIAKLESDVAAVTFLQQLQEHLIEVNRAYWAVYLSRAAYYQRKSLTAKTREILAELEERKELDPEATSSELFRARASLKKREADIKRAKMGVRIAEERLRALVNDPDLPMGSSGEWIPTSQPVLDPPSFNIRPVALAALANRPELIQGVLSVQAAAVQVNQADSELKPQLDMIAEVGYAGLDRDRDLGGAYSDMVDHGTQFRGGLRFSHQLERRFIKGRLDRRELEYLQRVDELNLIADRVMLDVLVAYREMLASYRDMIAKNQTLKAAREEVSDLEKRVDLEADEEARTIGYYLQLRLNALERQQVVEEEFLVSVVAYNTAIATLEKSQGTFLQCQNVEIFREKAQGKRGVDALRVSSASSKW